MSFFAPTMSAVVVFVFAVIVVPLCGLARVRMPDWITWAALITGILAGLLTASRELSVLAPLSVLAFSVIALIGWLKEEHWAGRYNASQLGRGALFHAYGIGAFFATLIGLLLRMF
ncbi:putative protein OS=Tsukamurella paurometabola (strain ATCC 8368 / DSM / CCUG 35730 /CIP 100753 / JCM 10117 / KCTC 9821 / NBRC 16120 / NCIMB 702349/ NCTC 13040) OX=521096 GN=Tpau_1804 PE=4 SV=1 [Tsukamurella paurometabola]|uniref:Uncharacterized protein n=1 Tax=Tsukamurella paurometabola (strain ATCC 8368 / DSM 20162 / CCUG 35730 / CIP 100753 / JCM 10117 / KCTC 9821 / NBRC 16120 / NCIMB 702349 / NCTC 13040) TaxID=521096 RepID=D5UME2_TSUPD|nr:hypothetical protein [Tsukamurella paurometabola]ADG78422.1 hypothetical protein Tpau_1804 [Tsukamurella paurometabola DSM 20162]SUP31574.1 Uncharacterised protein [Tsukamurella paurometabola]